MKQADLNRSLSRATGESVRTIRRMGFSLFSPDEPAAELEVARGEPQTVDWDQCEADRIALAIQA